MQDYVVTMHYMQSITHEPNPQRLIRDEMIAHDPDFVTNKPRSQTSGLVASSWFLGHSWEPITNLRAKKSAVSSYWSSQEFLVLQYRLCFCNVIGGENFLSGK